MNWYKVATKPLGGRLGDCYRLSGRYVLDNKNGILIHGTINGQRWTGQDLDNPHAWVEYDGKVFDPVWDQEFPQEVYYGIMQAKPQHRYNWEEMILPNLGSSGFKSTLHVPGGGEKEYVTFDQPTPLVNITGRVTEGMPPNGDFVDPADVGKNDVSPYKI